MCENGCPRHCQGMIEIRVWGVICRLRRMFWTMPRPSVWTYLIVVLMLVGNTELPEAGRS